MIAFRIFSCLIARVDLPPHSRSSLLDNVCCVLNYLQRKMLTKSSKVAILQFRRFWFVLSEVTLSRTCLFFNCAAPPLTLLYYRACLALRTVLLMKLQPDL